MKILENDIGAIAVWAMRPRGLAVQPEISMIGEVYRRKADSVTALHRPRLVF